MSNSPPTDKVVREFEDWWAGFHGNVEPGSYSFALAAWKQAARSADRSQERPCTCHPDDNPPRPCPQKFALTECRAAAEQATMPAIEDESYPYRLRDGYVVDTRGRRITVPGNLGIAQLLNTIVELRGELRASRSSARSQEDRAAACLHACEGLATVDLAKNAKGWLADVVQKCVPLEIDLEHYKRIVGRQDHGEAYNTQRRVNLDLSAQIEKLESALSATRASIIEECARACEKRAERRFDENGTREPDTGATYYGGSQAEEFDTRDEEDADCAAAVRALKSRTEGGGANG